MALCSSVRARSTATTMRSGNVSRPTPELHGEHIAAKFSSVFSSASVSPSARPSCTEIRWPTSNGRSLRWHNTQVLLSSSKMRARCPGLIAGRVRSDRVPGQSRRAARCSTDPFDDDLDNAPDSLDGAIRSAAAAPLRSQPRNDASTCG